MPFIVLAGLDGSGKSTVLNHIKNHLWPGVRGIYIGHRRPGVLHPAETPEEGGVQTITHYSKPNRSWGSSVLKLGVMALDWQIGYWRKLRPLLRTGHMVVFDRHYLIDIGIDPHRYRYGGPLAAVRLAQALTPTPDLVIFLDVTEEVSLARKQERGAENFQEQRLLYLAQAQRNAHWQVVDTTQPLDTVLAQVEAIIMATLGQQNKR